MPTGCKIVRAEAVIVLLTVLLLPASYAQVSTGLTESEPAPSQSVLTEQVDTAASSPASLDVTYLDGLLTIDVHNSSLAEVLQAVADKTGVAIDIPPSAGLERIVEHMGPGPVDDVLSRFLNGSPFDFVIVGSAEPPQHPTRILLMLHPSGNGNPVSMPNPSLASIAGPEPRAYGVGFRAGPEEDDSSSSGEAVSRSTTVAPPGSPDALPGAVLDQMQKDRLRQRQQMQERLQRPRPPDSSDAQ
jgi:hypothetical protein